MPLNFDLAGKVFDSVEVTIIPRQIEAYAAAASDTNPRYLASAGDQVGSPVFPVVPGLPIMLGTVGSDPDLGVENPLMTVHGEEEIVFHKPVRPGPLVLTPSLERVEDKGSGAIYVTKVAAVGLDGEPVVDQYATIFVRGGGSGVRRESEARPVPPVKGDIETEFTKHVDLTMPLRYADASGDHNPIHLDAGVATAVGLPGVINHGLGTLALVAGGLVDHLADGDPVAVRRLAARFTDMVIPGSDLATTVWSSASGAYLFETTRPDGSIVISGSIEMAGA
ncbi:MaoC family dehydratase N-terminal domain-containing protein [bacterium]|nr:MaoC family dehydratase N-terminal domain-containing protein [bacterium]